MSWQITPRGNLVRTERDNTKPIKLEPDHQAMLDVALDALKERRLDEAWHMFGELDKVDPDWVFAVPGRSRNNVVRVLRIRCDAEYRCAADWHIRTFTNEQRVRHILCAMLSLAIAIDESRPRNTIAELSDAFHAHREHIRQWIQFGLRDLGIDNRGFDPMTRDIALGMIEDDFAPADIRREERRRKWLASRELR